MSVRFIIGRAGSGKTRYCFDAIVRQTAEDPLGPPIFWLLPKQATFQGERQLACTSGLPAICRVEVLSFNQFGDRVLAHCGGSAVPEVTASGRQMILGHLLRTQQPELKFFSSVARQPGLAAELDSAFGEFERSGKSATDLGALESQLLDSGSESSAPLAAKLHDLRVLYDAYGRYLGNERLDPHRRFQQVLDSIANWPGIGSTSIYVDGFFEFTDHERRLLVALAKGGAAFTITLLIDPNSPTVMDPHHLPDEMSLFHRTEQTYRRLYFAFAEAGVTPGETRRLVGGQHAASESLKIIERDFFTRRSAKPGPTPGIALVEARDRRAEVDAAARHIRRLLDGGLRLRDIAVLARQLHGYQNLIDASFAEHGLPCFIDRRRTASHHPLVRFTRLLPALTAGQWPHDSMIDLLKSGLLGISLDDADVIENYVLSHRISGPGWAMTEPWTFRRNLTRNSEHESSDADDQIARIDKQRREVVEKLGPFSNLFRESTRLPIREIVKRLQAVYTRCDVRGTITRWMADATAAGNPQESAEHEQVWTELIELLDQMADLLGDETVTATEFGDILETGLERFDLAITPPTVDQILIGTIDRTRTPPLKAVILLGWHDGAFPRRPTPTPILSDSERYSLRSAHMDLSADTHRQLLDEQLLGYVALTRSSQQLCVMRPLADDAGKPLAPSPFWRRLRELLPDARVGSVSLSSSDAEVIGTPRQLVTALMHWVDSPTATTEPGLFASLYDWFINRPASDDSISQLRSRVWPALRYQNQATLSPEIASQLFSSPLTARVNQIESFATCPFKHFAANGLRLRGREGGEVSGMDLGAVYHSVLEKVVSDFIRNHRDWSTPSPETRHAIRHHSERIGKALRDEIMLSSARNRYLLERITKTLDQVMAAQEAALARGTFRPEKVAVRFDNQSGSMTPLAIDTPAGNQVVLTGSVDRVDIVTQPDGTGDVCVIDYRLGGGDLPLGRVYHGLSLQLLTYLLMLQSSGESLAGRPLTPAAAFYVKLLRRLQNVDHPSEAIAPDHPRFDLQVKPRGIFNSTVLRDLDSELATGKSDVVQVQVNKNGQIGNKRSSDAADPDEFAAVLRLVRQRIADLVDKIVTGDISIAPYRIAQESPCEKCDYRSVCRFDADVNRYNFLEPLSRVDVLERATSVESEDVPTRRVRASAPPRLAPKPEDG